MRRRSGAMHCETQQELVQLSSISDTSSGLFYNGKNIKSKTKTRKYAFSEYDTPSHQACGLEDSQQSSKNQSHFQGFEFDEQSYAFSKDCQELQIEEKNFSNKIVKTNYLILTKTDPNIIYMALSQALGISIPNQFQSYLEQSSCPLQLLIHKKNVLLGQTKFVDCYWIINDSKSPLYASLLGIYRDMCGKVLDLSIVDGDDGSDMECQREVVNKLRTFVREIARQRDGY